MEAVRIMIGSALFFGLIRNFALKTHFLSPVVIRLTE